MLLLPDTPLGPAADLAGRLKTKSHPVIVAL
jgi:hypothetical protein